MLLEIVVFCEEYSTVIGIVSHDTVRILGVMDSADGYLIEGGIGIEFEVVLFSVVSYA